MENVVRGVMMVSGEAEGDIMYSSEPLSFWGGYDQDTGEIIDRRHPLSGQNASKKILVIPSSRGSTTTVSVLLEAVMADKSPAAIVIEQVDPYFTLAAVVAKEVFDMTIPVVLLSQQDFARLESADHMQVYADGQIVL